MLNFYFDFNEYFKEKRKITQNIVKNDNKEFVNGLEVNDLIQNIMNLNEKERIELFAKIDNKKEIYFDYFNVYTDYIKNKLSKKTKTTYIGVDFITTKSLIRKKFNLDNINDDISQNKFDSSISLNDISKMSLKERLGYKKYQTEINSKSSIYEDSKSYIQSLLQERSELIALKNKDHSNNTIYTTDIEKDKLFNKIVIEDINDIMINNILGIGD